VRSDDLLAGALDGIAEVLDEGDGDIALDFLSELRPILEAMRGIDRDCPWCDCCATVMEYLIEHVGIEAYLDGDSTCVEVLYERVSAFWDSKGQNFPVPLADVRAYVLRHHSWLEIVGAEEGEDPGQDGPDEVTRH